MILLLVLIFAFLWWQRLHPYVVTREEMQLALQRTLEKKMPEDEWHRLVHKRISRDRYLDSLRQRLVDLPLLSRKDDTALYAPPEMAKIAALLDELRTKRA